MSLIRQMVFRLAVTESFCVTLHNMSDLHWYESNFMHKLGFWSQGLHPPTLEYIPECVLCVHLNIVHRPYDNK